MIKYCIDYEFGKAEFFTNETNNKKALTEFHGAASNCFGIRKSIGHTKIVSSEVSELPDSYDKTKVTHALFHNGDSILFDNSKGDWHKLKSEWD